MKFSFSILLMLLSYSVCFGQELTDEIRGVIVIDSSKTPVSGALVKLFSQREFVASTISNSNGFYCFSNFPLGNYHIEIVFENKETLAISDVMSLRTPGYSLHSLNIIDGVLAENSIQFVDFVYCPISTVVAFDEPGHKTYIADDLQRMPIRDISEITGSLSSYGLTSFSLGRQR